MKMGRYKKLIAEDKFKILNYTKLLFKIVRNCAVTPESLKRQPKRSRTLSGQLA